MKGEQYDQVTALAKHPEGLDKWRMQWELGVEPRDHFTPTIPRQEVVYQCFIREVKDKKNRWGREQHPSLASNLHSVSGIFVYLPYFCFFFFFLFVF